MNFAILTTKELTPDVGQIKVYQNLNCPNESAQSCLKLKKYIEIETKNCTDAQKDDLLDYWVPRIPKI